MKEDRKISKSFIVFLIISILIWFLVTLSKEYTASLTFLIDYKNIPQDKLLQKEPIKEIDAIIKSSGFKIITARFSDKKIVLDATNLKKKSSDVYYFLMKDQAKKIQKQLHKNIQIQEMLLDTIYLNMGDLSVKKVPLQPNLEIDYHIGYAILEPLKISPDSVLISGPEKQIKKIEKVDLEVLKLEDVKENFSEKVKIVLPQNANTDIKINLSLATVSGKVERFTEGAFEVPFKVQNVPDNIQLTTLNKTVKIIFVVDLPNFNKIDKNIFEVVCDYAISEKNSLGYLLPKIVRKPAFIKNSRIVPNKIDFLIQKE